MTYVGNRRMRLRPTKIKQKCSKYRTNDLLPLQEIRSYTYSSHLRAHSIVQAHLYPERSFRPDGILKSVWPWQNQG